MDESNSSGASLVKGPLGASQRGVAASVAGGPAVVRSEDNDGVFVLVSLL